MRARASEGARVRLSAFRILRRVEEGGAWASALLERARPALPDPRDTALLHEIVLGVLRHRAVLDHAIGRVASRSVERMDPTVRTALRIGAHALLLLDRVPGFAAVDTAVELVKRSGPRSGIGFVNGVLRRVAAEGPSLLPPAPRKGDLEALAVFHSHPRWWVERVVEREGWDSAVRLLEADNRPAQTVLRPNLRRTTPRDLARRLEAEGVKTEPGRVVPEALRVLAGVASATRVFRAGYAWAQDEASQLVPRMFGRVLRPSVADLCAAPGVKTLQLIESLPVGGTIVAVDRHPGRLRRLAANLARVEAGGVLIVAADSATVPAPLSGPFDHVLVDAPCSGTGTLRRHPEIRWRLRPDDLPALAARQARLMDAAASLLAPGGSLVYAVCSLEPEEREDVVGAFLSRHPGLRIVDPRAALPAPAARLVGADGALRTSPAELELDGFFAVRIGGERNAGSSGGAPRPSVR